MNKKYLISVAAAASIATVITGCGSSSSSDDTGAGAAVGPVNNIISGATASCESGSGTDTDNDGIITVSSTTPGICTVTGGNKEDGTAFEGKFKVGVADGSSEIAYATMITTEYENLKAKHDEATAKEKINAKYGIDEDEDVSAVNPTVDLSTDNYTKMKETVAVLETLTALGLDDDAIDNALADATNDDNLSAEKLVKSGVTLSDGQKDSITNMLEAIDENNAKAGGLDAALKTVRDAIKDDTNVTSTSIDGNISAEATKYQDRLRENGVIYFDGDQGNFDSDFSENNFKMKNVNVDGNQTADIIVYGQKENCNLTFKTVFKDVVMSGDANGSYTFKLTDDTEVEYSGKGYDGVVNSVKTTNANESYSSDLNETLMWSNAGSMPTIETESNTTEVEFGRIAKWTLRMLEKDSLDVNTSSANVDGNYTMGTLISIDGYTDVYNFDGNYSVAPRDTARLDVNYPAHTGTIVFDEDFTDVNMSATDSGFANMAED